MIENESQRNGALLKDAVTRPTQEHARVDAGAEDTTPPPPGPAPHASDAEKTTVFEERVVEEAADHIEKQGLTTSDLFAALRELGPVVSTLGILSLVLPGVMGAFVLVSVLAGLEPITELTSLASQFDPATTAWVMGGAAVLFAVVMALATGSIVLPTYASATVAGTFFGMATGSVVAMAGVTGGALVGYFWGVLLARGRVMSVIERHERANIIHRAIVGRKTLQEGGMVALIRIPPNSPFALTNLLMSSTSVGLLPYTIGTALGIAPRTLVAVWVGAQIKDAAEQGGGVLTTVAKIALGLVIFLVVYRIMSKWAREALANAVERGETTA